MEYVANALLSVHRPYGAHSSQDSTALQIQPGETLPDWVGIESLAKPVRLQALLAASRRDSVVPQFVATRYDPLLDAK